MQAIVLGAGITGLSMANLLQKDFEVTIIEKDNTIGGIAKTKKIDNITYHTVGGHCFNSKHQEVLDFVFSKFPISEWHKINRMSKINMGNYEINYPIEFSIQEIFTHDNKLAYEIAHDFLSSQDDQQYANLEDWFIKKFGKKLSEIYFIPYNTKIWGKEPKQMNHTWVQDKLPIPDKFSFFKGLLNQEKDTMPHATFYYPNSNNQKTFIEEMSKGLNIILNTNITHIAKKQDKWIINNEYEADLLISTIPLNILPTIIENTPQNILNHTQKLKYNKVSNVLWRSQPTNKHWTYQPLANTIFHRYIHIGNFFSPNKHYTITECIGDVSYHTMLEYGYKDKFLIEPIDHHISDHAYVVFDEHRELAVKSILDYLHQIGIFSIGRFGQWEYFNMDICIKQCLETYKKIKNQ